MAGSGVLKTPNGSAYQAKGNEQVLPGGGFGMRWLP